MWLLVLACLCASVFARPVRLQRCVSRACSSPALRPALRPTLSLRSASWSRLNSTLPAPRSLRNATSADRQREIDDLMCSLLFGAR